MPETVYQFTVKTYIPAESEEEAQKLLVFRLKEIHGRLDYEGIKRLSALDKGGLL